jgi:hypothetical protein
VGGQPIRGADYEVPIGINLSNVVEVLWAETTAAEPTSLSVKATVKGKGVEFSSVLLNTKDWYMVEVAVVPEAGKLPMVEPAGRIAGVKNVEFVQSVPAAGAKKEDSVLFRVLMGIQVILITLLTGLQILKARRSRLDG